MSVEMKTLTIDDVTYEIVDETARNTKQDTLTFDTMPTEGSTNPVTSGGVYTLSYGILEMLTANKQDKIYVSRAGVVKGAIANGNPEIYVEDVITEYHSMYDDSDMLMSAGATIDAIKANGTPLVTATSTDGVAYTATVDGMDSLVVGKEIMIIPDTNSTVVNPTLNVNDLGAKQLRCPVSSNNTTTTTGASATWIYSGKPVKVRWNGSFWVTDIIRMDASAMYNNVPLTKGGTGAADAATARTNLEVYSKTEVDDAIASAIGALGVQSYYTGTATPTSDVGDDGDLYLVTG